MTTKNSHTLIVKRYTSINRDVSFVQYLVARKEQEVPHSNGYGDYESSYQTIAVPPAFLFARSIEIYKDKAVSVLINL